MAVLTRAQDQGLPVDHRARDLRASVVPANALVAEPPLATAVPVPSRGARATASPTERATPTIETRVAERPHERATEKPLVLTTPSSPPTATATLVPTAAPVTTANPTPTARVTAVPAAESTDAIVQFDATATRLKRGQQTYICVGIDSGAAASVSGIGRIPAGVTTCHRIAPQRTTAYVLRVRAGPSSASRTITVTVVPTPVAVREPVAVEAQPSAVPTHSKYTVGT